MGYLVKYNIAFSMNVLIPKSTSTDEGMIFKIFDDLFKINCNEALRVIHLLLDPSYYKHY